MSTIQIVVPEDVFSAIEAGAKSQEVSIDAVASILLCHLVGFKKELFTTEKGKVKKR